MHSPSRRERRHATSVRVLGAFVACASAWVVVVTQLAAALHFALISHQICADHGELVHRELSVRHAVIGARETVATSGGTEADHDHCPLLSRRLERTAVLSAPGVRLPEVPHALASALVHAGGRTPTRGELLLSAPKQSPPV